MLIPQAARRAFEDWSAHERTRRQAPALPEQIAPRPGQQKPPGGTARATASAHLHI